MFITVTTTIAIIMVMTMIIMNIMTLHLLHFRALVRSPELMEGRVGQGEGRGVGGGISLRLSPSLLLVCFPLRFVSVSQK